MRGDVGWKIGENWNVSKRNFIATQNCSKNVSSSRFNLKKFIHELKEHTKLYIHTFHVYVTKPIKKILTKLIISKSILSFPR